MNPHLVPCCALLLAALSGALGCSRQSDTLVLSLVPVPSDPSRSSLVLVTAEPQERLITVGYCVQLSAAGGLVYLDGPAGAAPLDGGEAQGSCATPARCALRIRERGASTLQFHYTPPCAYDTLTAVLFESSSCAGGPQSGVLKAEHAFAPFPADLPGCNAKDAGAAGSDAADGSSADGSSADGSTADGSTAADLK